MLGLANSRVLPHCRHRRYRSSLAAPAPSVPLHQSASVVNIPHPVSSRLQEANNEWLKESLGSPLLDEQSGVRIYLAGTCPYAPHQHLNISELLSKVSPTHITVEQPPDPSPDVILPQPRWLQTIWDILGDEALKQLSTSNSTITSSISPSLHGPLLQQLQQISIPGAQVGRDIIDPFEIVGFYPGLDLLRSPQHSSTALQEFHFLPGLELLLAAQYAAEHGLQFLHLDAPIKLQESWVRRIVDGFKIREEDYAYNPNQDLDAVQQLLLDELIAWDEQLANLTAEQAMASAAAAASSSPSSSSSSNDASAGGQTAAAAAAAAGQDTPPPPSVEDLALVRYKVSRATAAATLSPAATATALQHMARLQPLKFRHMAEREAYMAQRLREISSKAAAACGLGSPIMQEAPAATTSSSSSSNTAASDKAAAVRGGATAATGSNSSSNERGSNNAGISSSSSSSKKGSTAGSSSSSPPVIVAVVGRQHVAGIRKAWNAKASYLWWDVMPRSFAPTAVVAEVVAD